MCDDVIFVTYPITGVSPTCPLSFSPSATFFNKFFLLEASLVELGKQLLAAARDGDTEGVRGLMARGAPFTAGVIA